MHHPSAEPFSRQTVRRGKHQIFIGMAPGVGKTYKMLEEAHLLKQEGIDVVVGVVETHGRKETADKIVDLEIVPSVAVGELGTSRHRPQKRRFSGAPKRES